MRNVRRFSGPGMLFLLMLSFLTACAGLGIKEKEKLQNLSAHAARTGEQVKERLAENPESPLSESLEVLNEVLNYADAVRAAPGRFDAAKIKEYSERISIINENIERFKDLPLKADVSFPIGTYRLSDLSARGQAECAELVEKIIRTVRDLNTRYPGYPIRITLKTIAYTDEIPVAGKRLRKIIRSHMQETVKGTERPGRQYNRILSRLRAESISNFIMTHLRKDMPGHIDIRYIEKIIGLGENYPREDMYPPYTARDERRRICIISPYIEILL